MLTIRAMSDGKGYSSRHLEHSDYYAEGERVTGVWQGRGAELLGLNGAVKTEDFEALRQSLDPRTNEFLRVRRSADRTAVRCIGSPIRLPGCSRTRVGRRTRGYGPTCHSL